MLNSPSRKNLRSGLTAGLALFVVTSAAVGGVSVEGQPVFGELGINLVTADPFDEVNFISQITDTGTIGPELEIVLIDPHMTGNFSNTGDTLVVHLNSGFTDCCLFNGLRFALTDPIAPEIVSLELVSSTFPGFDASRLSFDGTRLAMHMGSLSGVGDITIGITYESPPAGCTGDLDEDLTVGITDLLALLAAWGPNPGHPADFDNDDMVGITDLLTLLAAWGPCPGGPCPATGVTPAGNAPLPPDFEAQILGSLVVAEYLATFGDLGWTLDILEGAELFFDGMPVEAAGARHAMIPVTDGIGDAMGYFVYTYNPKSLIEGADLMQVFDEEPDNRLRSWVDPALDTAVDMLFDDDGCITGAATICPPNPGCTAYTRCMENWILTSLGSGGTAPTAACLARCASAPLGANCISCIQGGAGFIIGCWWSC